MRRLSAFIAITVLPLAAVAQKPYFQQNLYYDIRVELDPESATLAGIENIVYHNNSPDTLNEIYFYLYYNAFQPGSYLDRQDRRLGDYRIASTPPENQGRVDIDLIKVNGEIIGSHSIDNTVMTVPLPVPLAPGDSVRFYIEFTSQIPARGSRTARAGRHFDIGQWYPKPAVYDRYGWHVHQYLDYEFYADYADFDVELTLPQGYIVAHMGKLLNEEEIFGKALPVPEGDSIIVSALNGIWPDSALKRNGGDEQDTDDLESELKEVPDTASATNTKNDLKTWKMRAENVHDFAFCADPKFIMDMCRWGDTTIKVYYDKGSEGIWARHVAFYTRESIKLFSSMFFAYPYGQYSVVASLVSGGMEYPQLTMISGRYNRRRDYSHGLESTVAHEVGHAWFYGILGFNETEQSYLDEGFATFATTVYLENRYGRYENNFSYKKAWERKFLPNGNERNDNQRIYITRARNGDEDPMITPANQFLYEDRYYNASYEKASSVYFMLQYTLGDEKFERFIKLLFIRWAFKHPYLSDLQKLAEEVYGADLNWFFRQWFTATWTLDYSLDRLKRRMKKVDGESGYDVSITIGKKGRCISPLDVALYLGDGSIQTVRVPIEVWIDGEESFDTTVFVRSSPKKGVINPDGRLADTNRLNNSSGFMPVRHQLLVPKILFRDSYVEQFVDSYTLAHQPTVWYNSVDGLKPGYRFTGSYLGQASILDGHIGLGLQNGKVNHSLGYENPLYGINPEIHYYLRTTELDGRGLQVAGLSFLRSGERRGNLKRAVLSARRRYVFDDEYIYGDGWSRGDVNTIELKLERRLRRSFSRINLDASLVTSIPGGNYDFTRADAGLSITLTGIPGKDINIGIKAGIANGSVPNQQKFYLSSADPYEIWESPFFRSRGTLPDRWKDEERLFKPGGAGLYGYLDRGLTGTRMVSLKISKELSSIRLPVRVPVLYRQLMRVSPQLYFASGLVWERGHNPEFNDYLSEAGLTLAYDVPYLNRLVDESRITLYLPLWLSDPADGDGKLEWRWLFSITK